MDFIIGEKSIKGISIEPSSLLVNKLKAAGCVGAIERMRGYYPQSAFFWAWFFPYFQAVNLVAWIFNPDLCFKNIHKVYEIHVLSDEVELCGF